MHIHECIIITKCICQTASWQQMTKIHTDPNSFLNVTKSCNFLFDQASLYQGKSSWTKFYPQEIEWMQG